MTNAPSQNDTSLNTSLDVIYAAYPRIYKSIELLWGTAELNDKFNEWIIMDRESSRQGFPAEVAFALVKVAAAHQAVFADAVRANRADSGLTRKDIYSW